MKHHDFFSSYPVIRAVTIAVLLCVLGMVASVAFAQAPIYTVTLTVNPTSGKGSVTPSVSWSTSPAGATSCVASGAWTGTKATSGTQTLPAITATSQYKLDCTWPGAAGTANVSWTPPTTNSDGSPLTDLTGYRIVYGTTQGNPNARIDVAGAATTSATVPNLTNGSTYYFYVRSVNAAGTESVNSNVASRTIVGGTPPTASASATVTVDKVPSPPTGVTVVETTAYAVRFDAQRWVALRGTPAGRIKLGAACDESRSTADGYTVISRPSQVLPRPATGTVLVAKCG